MQPRNCQNFFWSTTPFDEKSESDSDNQNSQRQDEIEPVFQMDGVLPSVSSLTTSESTEKKYHHSHTSYGRLRHEGVQRITTELKYELPGDYIRCFSNGHLSVNIPDYSEPVLQLPDNVGLIIKLSDYFDNYMDTAKNGVSVVGQTIPSTQAASEFGDSKVNTPEQDSNIFGRFSSFTAHASTDSEIPSHGDVSQAFSDSCNNHLGHKERFWHANV